MPKRLYLLNPLAADATESREVFLDKAEELRPSERSVQNKKPIEIGMQI